MAFSTWIISLATNMTTVFTLRWIISRPTIAVEFQPRLASCKGIPGFDWSVVCFPDDIRSRFEIRMGDGTHSMIGLRPWNCSGTVAQVDVETK